MLVLEELYQGALPPELGPANWGLLAWFQAVSTRTAGFNAVDMQLICPALALMYCILMYVSRSR